jgi:peptidoglycan/xylan/chitin deacetylase (PgdA/CDA1 family)
MTPKAYEVPRTAAAMLRRLVARYAARDPLLIPETFRCVSFTFDDFPKSAAITGRSILEDFGWRGTWFASGCYAAGTTLHYGPMYNAADLASLSGAGHEIGDHTFGHLDCARSSETNVLADIQRNAEFLMSAAGISRPLSFAFPYGETTPGLKKRLGGKFAGLRGVRRGVNRAEADRCLIRSVPVVSSARRLEEALTCAEELAACGGWLVYSFHDIQAAPTRWGCRPEDFTTVLQSVREIGADIRTFGEALQQLAPARSDA